MRVFILIKRSKNKALRKLKSKSGLSFVELLATVVLIGLMGIVITTGVTTINNTYKKIVKKANEQTLLSTTLIELKNLLRYSSSITVDESGNFDKAVSEKGIWYSLVNTDDGIKIAYLSSEDATPTDANTYYLVSKDDGEISGIYSSFEKITYSNGVFAVHGLKVGDTELIPSPFNIAHIEIEIGRAS